MFLMTSKPPPRGNTSKKITQIRNRISAFDFACSGTLSERTTVCGKPTCRCAKDPHARHGPYYEWTRREDGRLAHTNLSVDEAKVLRRAIRNYREIQKLLRQWERESLKVIRAGRQTKPKT